METSTPIIPGLRQALLTFLKRVDYRIPHFMIRSVGPMGLTPADGAEALAILQQSSTAPGFNPFGIRTYNNAAAFARTMQLYFEGEEN